MPGQKTSSQAAEVAEAFEQHPLFSALPPGRRLELGQVTRVRTLGPGEVLWRAGQKATHIGLVIAGRLTLTRHSAEKDTLVEVTTAGELVGDVGFALSGVYSSTAVAPRRARVALIPSDELHATLEQDIKATTALVIQLAGRVSRLLSRLETLTELSVDRRLSRTLLDLADQLGQPFPGGVLIPVRLRRRDLASLAATTLETTSRKLTAWAKLGFLVTQPAGLLLRDPEALRRIASGRDGRSNHAED